jgi:hypothetical protein
VEETGDGYLKSRSRFVLIENCSVVTATHEEATGNVGRTGTSNGNGSEGQAKASNRNSLRLT